MLESMNMRVLKIFVLMLFMKVIMNSGGSKIIKIFFDGLNFIIR